MKSVIKTTNSDGSLVPTEVYSKTNADAQYSVIQIKNFRYRYYIMARLLGAKRNLYDGQKCSNIMIKSGRKIWGLTWSREMDRNHRPEQI